MAARACHASCAGLPARVPRLTCHLWAGVIAIVQREITVGDTLEMFIITSEGTRVETFDLKKD